MPVFGCFENYHLSSMIKLLARKIERCPPLSIVFTSSKPSSAKLGCVWSVFGLIEFDYTVILIL